MAVAYDTASSEQVITAVTGAAPSWNHTASGSNRYLRVYVSWVGFSGQTVSGTYGGVSMTHLGNDVASGSGFNNADIFEVIAPSTGATAIVLTFTAEGAVYARAVSVSYTGVHQTVPSGTPVVDHARTGIESQTNTSTATVTSSAGDMVGGCIAIASGATSLSGNRTARMNGAEGGLGYLGAAQDTTTSGSVAMTWNWTNVEYYAHIAASILQAAGGAAYTPNKQKLLLGAG